VSPKNKGKFGKAKPQIEEQDEFVSGVARVSEKLKPYAWRIAVVAVVVAIGLVSFATYRWWQNRKATRATNLFVEAMEIGGRPVMAEPVDDPAGAEPEPSFATVALRNEAQLAALSRLSSSYGSTGVGRQSRLLEAALLLQLGKHDEAIRAFQAYLGRSGPEILTLIAREGIGYALEAKALAQTDAKAQAAGLREAIAAFQKIQPKADGLYHDYALFHEARILATMEEREQAIAIYNRILDLEPPSPLNDRVNQRLALLKAVPE
jgi:hypothetical protein